MQEATLLTERRLRNRKNYMLTYPHCDVDIGELIEQLRGKIEEFKDCKVVYAIACAEKHQTGIDHRHVLLMLDRPIDITKEDLRGDLFKVTGNNKVFIGHIDTVRSPKDAIGYVKKEGNYVVWGTCPYKVHMGQREKNMLLQSKPMEELVESGEVSIFKIPQLKKAKEILQYERLENTRRAEAPKVYWFWGETGSGKTKEAVRIGEEEYEGDYWLSNSDDSWYDGYHGQRCVILDDLRSTTWKFANLLRITDRYKLRVPVKGAFIPWIPECIIITAPGTPEDVYKNHSTGEAWDGIEQLERRITEVREFTIDDGN